MAINSIGLDSHAVIYMALEHLQGLLSTKSPGILRGWGAAMIYSSNSLLFSCAVFSMLIVEEFCDCWLNSCPFCARPWARHCDGRGKKPPFLAPGTS